MSVQFARLMPSPISGTPSPSPQTSRAVRAIDILCLALVILSVVVAMSGGFRVRLGRVADRGHLAVSAAVVGAGDRHRPSLHRAGDADLSRPAGAPRGRGGVEPGVHTAAIVVAGTRPAILFVGYMALLMFGYPPGPEPPKLVDNELINLSARWDANWYLGIATEGYHFVPNKPGLQQSIAFFPAYPMLVRVVARILGGYVPGYIACGPVRLARGVSSARSSICMRWRATHSAKTKPVSRSG